jgi:hypothetical protein
MVIQYNTDPVAARSEARALIASTLDRGGAAVAQAV